MARKDESSEFVNILLDLSRCKEVSFYVGITMRSDFIGDCAQFYGLPEAINKGLYLVPRLKRTQLEVIVEAPVRLYNQQISPALTTRLLNDVQTIEDALPLMQHVLMRTWNYALNENKNGEVDLEDYKCVGGIERALSNHADEVLLGMPEEALIVTKKIFQALTSIDQNGRKIRRAARLSELVLITNEKEEALQQIISRFTEKNTTFLITSKVEDKDDQLIDISHESLIRQWSLLNEWVDREADAAKIFMRLIEAEKLYKEKNKNLLAGNELNQFWRWYLSFKPDAGWARRYSHSYNDCIDYLKQSNAAEKKQLAAKVRNKRLLIGATVLVMIVITLFAAKVYSDFLSSSNQLALNYWDNSQSLAKENKPVDALHLVAEAAVTSHSTGMIKIFLLNGESLVPAACLKKIYPVSSNITSAVFSPDNKWILVAEQNGAVFIMDKETGNKVREFKTLDLLPHTRDNWLQVRCLAPTNNGY